MSHTTFPEWINGANVRSQKLPVRIVKFRSGMEMTLVFGSYEGVPTR